jgi:transposase
VWILLAGVLTKCYLFTFRLSYSGKSVHRVTVSCGQEAFFEGHAHAFGMLGGVPCGKVRYDNLLSAVARVLGFGRARVETDRWAAFRSHFGLDAFYCMPGIEGAHEKGGVEGEVGRKVALTCANIKPILMYLVGASDRCYPLLTFLCAVRYRTQIARR